MCYYFPLSFKVHDLEGVIRTTPASLYLDISKAGCETLESDLVTSLENVVQTHTPLHDPDKGQNIGTVDYSSLDYS